MSRRKGNIFMKNFKTLADPLIFGIITILAIAFIIICSVNMAERPKPDFAIIKQYKILQQDSIDNYNMLLANSQKSGMLINVNGFNEDFKFRLDDFNKSSKIKYKNISGSFNAIDNLINLLKTNNNKLVFKLKKINKAMSNNMRIDYNSLKVTNINDSTSLQTITKQYVKDNRNAEMLLKMAITTMTIVFATIIIGFILRVLISTM